MHNPIALFFTPYTYLFLSVYSLVVVFMFLSPNFLVFWILSELLTLVFIGISLTLFTNSYSSLLVYFLIQVFSSFNVFLFYLFPSVTLFTFSLLLNFGFFPFHIWFVSASYRFPNFILFLSSTIHKLPFFYALNIFPLPTSLEVFVVSACLTTLVSGLSAFYSSDTRLLLVFSSVSNNSWIMFSSLSSLEVFLTFGILYTLSVFIVINSMFSVTNISQASLPYLINLSGLPPLPLFAPNILIVASLAFCGSFTLNSFIFLFLVFNIPILSSYVSHSSSILLISQASLPSHSYC